MLPAKMKVGPPCRKIQSNSSLVQDDICNTFWSR